MNRMSPLIVRRVGPMAASATLPAPAFHGGWSDEQGWNEDLRTFVTFWLGGLVFFGTLIA